MKERGWGKLKSRNTVDEREGSLGGGRIHEPLLRLGEEGHVIAL